MPSTATLDPLWIDGNGKILERHMWRNEVTGGWRFVVRFRRLDRGKSVALRAHLHRGSEAPSET
jgi:glucans biosynthesis protein